MYHNQPSKQSTKNQPASQPAIQPTNQPSNQPTTKQQVAFTAIALQPLPTNKQTSIQPRKQPTNQPIDDQLLGYTVWWLAAWQHTMTHTCEMLTLMRKAVSHI
jgi:hypothetical protein